MIVAPQAWEQRPPSTGRQVNTGAGPMLVPLDIGHQQYLGLIDPDTAFWSLVAKDALAETLEDAAFVAAYRKKAAAFAREMHTLRFGRGLSAVYVNPTERCNLNCKYCYIPETMRRSGTRMTADRLLQAMEILREYFKANLSDGRLPQVIFHGAEPLLERDSIFAAIEKFQGDFRFGIQTNGTLLDNQATQFLKATGTGVGLSLDGPAAGVADRTRKTWGGTGVFEATMHALDLLRGYPGLNVICTVTRENMAHLTELVHFFHEREAQVIMLNMVRCTQPGARDIKPQDAEVFPYFKRALEHTQALYRETGRKLIVANFANILISILAPSARRLMCDISPCGGGRIFFALAPDGGIYPCSEFIGLPQFCGGNLFSDQIDAVLDSEAFRKVTGRQVEDVVPCRQCAIRHFCGSPCPAEAYAMNGAMNRTGAFCGFYEEQVRFAFRLIADQTAEDFLWDGWDQDTETLFNADSL